MVTFGDLLASEAFADAMLWLAAVASVGIWAVAIGMRAKR